ncbi:hypothetical protein C5E45_24550 [Nocardia nova]|uniref:Periplasmic binding protein domain-containing protein n=1 Tax=Nocardia nova TaxID=37330 RepID=A0A2S6AKG4_9NOCA|nr:substrate-binding domain-containing protein [Nocardia nova]PPJ35714.1 hypothetical protein C5E45_24550 [Nocardia nova]
MRKTKSAVVVAAAVLTAFSAAACNSSNEPTANSSATSSDVTAAKTAVDQAYGGLYTAPAPGPVAQKGKNVWVVSCSQALPGCAEPATAIQNAAKVLDWNITVVDAKGTPAGMSSAIRQAVAAKADGIIGVAVDCPSAKGALSEAKAAKIPTVGVYAYDCNDPKVNGGDAEYTALINNNGTPGQFGSLWGKLKADYAIASTGGKAKIVQVTHPDFLVTQYEFDGYNAEINKCSSCQVVDKVDITAGELGQPGIVAQKVATALQQHPDANVLEIPDDSTLALSVQSVKAANRKDLKVIAGEGYPSTFDFIRSRTVTAAVAIPADWLGWSGADALNRIFAGQADIPNEGASFQIIDAEHGLPPAGQGWTPKFDYISAFTRSWQG